MNKFCVGGYLIALVVMGVIAQPDFDYGSALDAAIKFYDANRCGPDAGKDNEFSWRGACHVNDKIGSDDVTGGYHDAGDHVKFGLPQCWSAAILGWAMYEYPSVFASEPRKTKYFRMLKWFTDYFLKCHPVPGKFYYNVGDGNVDHGYWGAPELQPAGVRAVLSAPPGADVCAEASASLALMSLNYKSIDAVYAQKCLDAAVSLYTLALANAGSSSTGRAPDGSGGNFYKSSSHYDDLCWGGIWLYTATGKQSYLDSIDRWTMVPNDYGDNNYQKRWSPAWDDVSVFVLLKMGELTGNDKYVQGVVYNLDWFRDVCNKTPFGLPWLNSWAPLRYASSEAGQGYLAYKALGYDGFVKKGDLILDYCLGKNPLNRSYVTGWGNNPVLHPHHRANEPLRGGPTKGIIGALVGGPDMSDSYTDDVSNYVQTEVTLDYNASFILGLAGKLFFKNGGKPSNRPPSVNITSPLTGVALPRGAAVIIRVSATDHDGKVTKISLFRGNELLTSGTMSPLTFTWNVTTTGDFSFKASATDDSGKVSNSPIVTVSVSEPCTPGQMQNRTGWVPSASSSSPNANEGPAGALDGTIGNRWSSGKAMAPDMWFQVDMGYPRSFDQIVMECGGGDFPPAYKVYAANDTGAWGAPIASGIGAMSTIVALPASVTAQIIRIVCGESNGNWWSIHEFNVRCASSSALRFDEIGLAKPAFDFKAMVKNRVLSVNYSLPVEERVTIEAFSLNGARIGVLADGIRSAGNHFLNLNSNHYGQKIVLFKISTKESSQIKRVSLVNVTRRSE
jgi:endoglucanase